MKKTIILITLMSLLLISLFAISIIAINNEQFVYISCKDDSLYYDQETHFVGVMDYKDFILGRKMVDDVMLEGVDGVFTDSGMDDGVKFKDYCKIYRLTEISSLEVD